ncbi:tol-pal system protein YbgF [Jannaschia seohaensis]|uniref:Cell division coordinator CpoB n=1 Tax=Jannaschia seohaensis TaxID=475081 RepID=A0A2Y9A2Y9_9RHOB|nr:tol-pal system protein YbgF [Jannaschia seohaensis]PWJ22516.1 tol-pal system protein YbgF [Jannaschia seohaensis]SSA38794.1 tol-pal system protein YbgF [Jannaschia seohaensis]
MRLALALLLATALPAPAQDQAQTLSDIRRQLSVLNQEMAGLRAELQTTGAAVLGIEGSSFPDRVIALEGQLQELTARTEQLSFRVESVARDGGNRIEDLRFQLCELTPDCDLGSLPNPGPLGGAPTAPGPVASGPVPVQRPTGGTTAPPASTPELAVGEQAEFDAARALLESGQNAEAAQAFSRFTTSYPTGPLTGEATFLRAQALARNGQAADAARAYLESFSGSPQGPRAAESLLGLGRSLGTLGQTDEACLTLSEVLIRFPNAPAAAEAQQARTGLGCA